MTGRLLPGLAAAVTLIGCHRQENRTDANFPVGNLSLHLLCEGSGTPAVVLESGLGNDATSWSRVQPEVARFTRVCAYDRAGLGASSPAPRPHSNAQMARELRVLLRTAKDFDTLAKGLAESKASPGWLHDKPLVVLTRGKEEGFPGASD